MIAALKRREELLVRLQAAIYHLPPSTQLGIVASPLSLDQLEELVKFQEEGRN